MKRHLGFPELLDENGEERLAHYDKDDEPVSSEATLWEDITAEVGGENWEFDWDIRQDEGRKFVWFRSEVSGQPYQVCCVVHAFLKALRSEGDDVFVLTWADTCDKLRADAFGGGTMVATKKGVGVCHSDGQVELAKRSVVDPWNLPLCTTG